MKLVTKLKRAGYAVTIFSQHHIRVNDELDLFPNERGRPISWHDRLLNVRGSVWPENVIALARERMNAKRAQQATKQSFIKTITETCGWSLEEAEQEWESRIKNQTEGIA